MQMKFLDEFNNLGKQSDSVTFFFLCGERGANLVNMSSYLRIEFGLSSQACTYRV